MKSMIIVLLSLIWLPAFAQETEGGNTITTFSGDEVTMSVVSARTINVKGKKLNKIVDKPRPLLLNGKDIYNHFWEENEAVYETEAHKKSMEEHTKYQMMIDELAKDEKRNLKEGEYALHLTNMVVNEQGYIVYYETKGLERYHKKLRGTTIAVNNKAAENINTIVQSQVHKMRFTTFVLDNTPRAYIGSFTYFFIVGE
ncbi:MAG: hypothetical protein R2800_13535 [Flavipsychrobacter sp.]